jgi:hypothetical protein
VTDPTNVAHLSTTAKRLLQAHKPETPAFPSWTLGPARDEVGLKAIDAAYAKLVAGGLVEPIEKSVSVLSSVKRSPFVLTQAGKQALER